MKLSRGQFKTAVKRYPWIAIIIVLAGFVVGYKQISSGLGKKPERRAGARQAVPVHVANVVQKTIPVELRAVGTVEAYSTVSVRSQITGSLTRVHFKEGRDVQKGDLLFTIDPRPFEAALKQAEAILARDVAQLENALQQARRYEELVDEAQEFGGQ